MPDIDLSEYLEKSEPPEPTVLKWAGRSHELPAEPPLAFTVAVGNVIWAQSDKGTKDDVVDANRELGAVVAKMCGPLAAVAPAAALIKATLTAYGYAAPEPSASSDSV